MTLHIGGGDPLTARVKLVIAGVVVETAVPFGYRAQFGFLRFWCVAAGLHGVEEAPQLKGAPVSSHCFCERCLVSNKACG